MYVEDMRFFLLRAFEVTVETTGCYVPNAAMPFLLRWEREAEQASLISTWCGTGRFVQAEGTTQSCHMLTETGPPEMHRAISV